MLVLLFGAFLCFCMAVFLIIFWLLTRLGVQDELEAPLMEAFEEAAEEC